nr:uncharacterized protein CTRU02_11124 [Colletotrichum truncatum]KAF6786253.1 hypothetical protein CTRU02_11124 [Colletotrichum truncatum]
MKNSQPDAELADASLFLEGTQTSTSIAAKESPESTSLHASSHLKEPVLDPGELFDFKITEMLTGTHDSGFDPLLMLFESSVEQNTGAEQNDGHDGSEKEARLSYTTKSLQGLGQRGVSPREEFGKTPLHIASELGHADIVDILLDSGAQIDAVDGYRRTSLQYGAEQGHRGIVEKLLGAGADSEMVDGNGMTALHIAVCAGHGSVVKLLVRNGANPNIRVGFTSHSD